MQVETEPADDWRELAALIPNAEVERVNKELNAIYEKSLWVQFEAKRPGQEEIRSSLEKLRKAVVGKIDCSLNFLDEQPKESERGLSYHALQIVAVEQRKALQELGVTVPP